MAWQIRVFRVITSTKQGWDLLLLIYYSLIIPTLAGNLRLICQKGKNMWLSCYVSRNTRAIVLSNCKSWHVRGDLIYALSGTPATVLFYHQHKYMFFKLVGARFYCFEKTKRVVEFINKRKYTLNKENLALAYKYTYSIVVWKYLY